MKQKVSTEISTKELSEILVTAIREENFFTKDFLIPKIKAIITGFRLRLAAANYNKLESPTQTARLIRANELHNLEKVFWQNALTDIVGVGNIQKYFDELNKQRLIWDGVDAQINERPAKLKNRCVALAGK